MFCSELCRPSIVTSTDQLLLPPQTQTTGPEDSITKERETDSRDWNQRRNKRSKEHSNNDQDQCDRYRINTLNVGYGLSLNVVVEGWCASDVYSRALITDDISYPYIMPDLWHTIHRVRTVRPEIENHQHSIILGRCELGIHILAWLHRICQHVVVTEDLQP